MSRQIHFIPEGGALVEVTCRTLQNRFLLLPGDESNALIRGVLARAARLYQDWPGVHCVEALLTGALIEGLWYDRTQEYAARRRGKVFIPSKYATTESLALEPLPCWSHLPEGLQATRGRDGRSDRGGSLRDARGKRDPAARPRRRPCPAPHDGPFRTKKGPAPLVHAASRAARREIQDAYSWFLAAFRGAAESLRAGDLDSERDFRLGASRRRVNS